METARVKVRIKEIKPGFWAWMLAHGHIPPIPSNPPVLKMPEPPTVWWPYEVTCMSRLEPEFENAVYESLETLYEN